jgi:hypothetical protein
VTHKSTEERTPRAAKVVIGDGVALVTDELDDGAGVTGAAAPALGDKESSPERRASRDPTDGVQGEVESG